MGELKISVFLLPRRNASDEDLMLSHAGAAPSLPPPRTSLNKCSASLNKYSASLARDKIFSHTLSAPYKSILHSFALCGYSKNKCRNFAAEKGKASPCPSTTRYACNAPALSGHPLYEQRGSWVNRNRGASHSSRRRDETRKRGSLSLASPRNPLLYPLRATRSSS